MPILTAGNSVTLTLTDYDTVYVEPKNGRVQVTAVSGLGITPGSLGEITYNRSFGPYTPGQIALTASDHDAFYDVVDGVRPITPGYAQDSSGNPIGLVGSDGAVITTSKRPLRTLNFIGDSLTIFGTQPQIPTGVGFWNLNALTNISGNWVFLANLDGRASALSGTPGILDADGNGRLRFTYPGDSTGPWVDVSLGGFFELPSGSPTVVGHSLYVAICQGNAALYAPTTAKSDSITTAGIVQSQEAPPHVYSGQLQALLGPNVTCGMYGISGDKVSGVVGARWLQAVRNRPDAVSVLIGVNDVPSSGSAAQTLANQLITCLKQMAQYVGKIYVGGIFPNGNVNAAANGYLSIYSSLLRDFCFTRPDVYRYWDAWNTLLDPAATGVTLKTGAYYSDNIHLQPYGAYLAAQPLLTLLNNDFALPPVSSSRGFASYDSSTLKGALNANPRLTYTSGGTGSGSGGVTGNVPDSYGVTRSGSAQACALSYVSRPDGLNALQIQVSGAAANDYHELAQTVTLPAGVTVGSVVAFEIDFEIIEATGLSTFQAQINSNSNIQSAYVLQPPSGRNYSNFNSTTGVQPRQCVRSKPVLIVSGVTNFSMRLRIGGGVGTTATIIVRRFEIIQVS